jgi:hypothetical protein
MSAAITARAIPSAAALDEMSWNYLAELAPTSKNRKLLAGIVHAENACISDGPSHHISDNRIVATIVDRAIQKNWRPDVLESAAGSRHMTPREFGAILGAGRVFPQSVYSAILNSSAVQNPALMSMLQNVTPYPAVRTGGHDARVSMILGTIEAAIADPAIYALDDNGDEHPAVPRAVTIALALDRYDRCRAGSHLAAPTPSRRNTSSPWSTRMRHKRRCAPRRIRANGQLTPGSSVPQLVAAVEGYPYPSGAV